MPPARHAREVVRRRRRQEAGRAAVRDPAAVPVARLRPGGRRRAADEGEVRRPDGLHPPGGLRRTTTPTRGCASRCRQFNLPTEPWLFVVGKDGRITARLEGSFGLERLRAGAQDRALCTHRSCRRTGPRAASARTCRSRSGCSAGRRRSCSCISFVALAALWPKPRLEDPGWRPLPGGPGAARLARRRDRCAALIGVALLALVARSPATPGRGTALDNFAPTFILIIFWVGLVFASVLFGDVFRALQPVAGDRARAVPRPRAAAVPGAARAAGRPRSGCSCFTWIELASGWGEQPATLATAVARLHASSRWSAMARLRGRAVGAPRRGVRGLLQPLLAHVGVRDARPRGRRAAAARRPAAARPGRRARSRSSS